jgi:hypothetical protein
MTAKPKPSTLVDKSDKSWRALAAKPSIMAMTFFLLAGAGTDLPAGGS